MIKIPFNKLILYIITILFLFSIPILTIFSNYYTIKTGKVYLFKIEAYDPYDMFRGNYLDIKFKNDNVVLDEFIDDSKDIYVEIYEENGFAYFKNVSNQKPKNTKNYYKTKGYYREYNNTCNVITPSRYYMNEKKSKNAEKIFHANLDNAYAKVSVKNGKMNILGIYINNQLIDNYQ